MGEWGRAGTKPRQTLASEVRFPPLTALSPVVGRLIGRLGLSHVAAEELEQRLIVTPHSGAIIPEPRRGSLLGRCRGSPRITPRRLEERVLFTPDCLVFGTAQIGMPYGIANRGHVPNRREALELLAAARDLGIQELDTAPDYGKAEARIGAFLKGCAHSVEVATKLPGLPEGLDSATLRRQVDRAITGSLRRLGVERISRYLIHRTSDLFRYGEPLVDVLEEQMTRQRIGAIGLSAYAPAEARLMLNWPIVTVLQHPLSVLDRRLLGSDCIGDLRARGVRVEARSVLLQGLLALEPNDPVVDRLGARDVIVTLRDVLEAIDTSPLEIALPFVLAAGADRVVIGADNPSQLTANVKSLEQPFGPTLMDVIHALPHPDDALIDPRRWPGALTTPRRI